MFALAYHLCFTLHLTRNARHQSLPCMPCRELCERCFPRMGSCNIPLEKDVLWIFMETSDMVLLRLYLIHSLAILCRRSIRTFLPFSCKHCMHWINKSCPRRVHEDLQLKHTNHRITFSADLADLAILKPRLVVSISMLSRQPWGWKEYWHFLSGLACCPIPRSTTADETQDILWHCWWVLEWIMHSVSAKVVTLAAKDWTEQELI